MVKQLMKIIGLSSLFLCQILMVTAINGEEQKLTLKYKVRAIEQIKKDYPIAGFALSIADTNNDNKNELVVSGNGYMRIFEWNGTTFEPKWKSPQFSHQLGSKQFRITLYDISPLVITKYYVDNKLLTDNLFFVYTTPKAGPVTSDIYRVTVKNNNYELQKISESPFNRFDLIGTCLDGSSVLIGRKAHKDGNYAIMYKWNGSALIEKWQGVPGSDIKVTGVMLSNSNKAADVFLVQDNKKIGILSCISDRFDWKVIDMDAGMKDLFQNNRIDTANSKIGFTKKNSICELWNIQGSDSDYEYYAKLYVSQFDKNKFSPLSRVYFKGINSDMIFKMTIADVDNDGVGEILGVEEEIRKKIPRKHPRGTGEEGDTLLITSNLFLAKWNGKEYEVKWHRKAIDERVSNIAVGDVTGNGKKEILVTDDNGYLYVFDMPAMQ